jgi:uncharacterized protein YukE
MGVLHLHTVTEGIQHAETDFVTQAALMRSTIGHAETEAEASQAYHQGPAAVAFRGAHMRFVAAAAQVNTLLDLAQANLGDAATKYVGVELHNASTYNNF